MGALALALARAALALGTAADAVAGLVDRLRTGSTQADRALAEGARDAARRAGAKDRLARYRERCAPRPPRAS